MNDVSKNKKPVCLHFHIFKNAGMTIGWILEKNFGKNHVRMDVDVSDEILPMEVIIDYLGKNSEVKAFSSHLSKLPIPENTNFEIIPILFIRNPIDRIFSIYHYNRDIKNDNSLGCKKAKSLSFAEYIKWEFEQKKRMNMKNFQTLYLSDKDIKSYPISSDLELAKNRLKIIPVLGIVDRFDESLVYAEEFLQSYFPNIDLAYTRQNVTSNKNLTLSEKLEAKKSEIGEDLMNELNDKNKLDLELYTEANKILTSRIEEIDRFDTKLNNFRERCKSIQKTFSNSDPIFKHPRLWYSLEKKKFH